MYELIVSGTNSRTGNTRRVHGYQSKDRDGVMNSARRFIDNPQWIDHDPYNGYDMLELVYKAPDGKVHFIDEIKVPDGRYLVQIEDEKGLWNWSKERGLFVSASAAEDTSLSYREINLIAILEKADGASVTITSL